MVYFFGILSPHRHDAAAAPEAPRKTAFFGGAKPDQTAQQSTVADQDRLRSAEAQELLGTNTLAMYDLYALR